MTLRRFSVLFLTLTGAVACGGGGSSERSLDESGDEGGAGGERAAHVVEMPTGLGGTEWRWTEAHCTEAPLDLAARGFESHLRVAESGGALLLYQDQSYASTGCALTVVSRVSSPETPGELHVEEIARVAVPSTPECFGQPEPPRPGEVRRTGRRLEVLVQRSRWCGGFEARFVYEAEMPRLLTNAEVVRHYAVYFSLGDADGIASLFSTVSSLAEPFTTTVTGDPYRHEGRDAVRTWYAEAFAGTAWRALRITGTTPGATEHELTVGWEYMDSRLAGPVTGRNHFTTAAGEIFEARIELDGTPELSTGLSGP